jgi:hypothetical protein
VHDWLTHGPSLSLDNENLALRPPLGEKLSGDRFRIVVCP